MLGVGSIVGVAHYRASQMGSGPPPDIDLDAPDVPTLEALHDSVSAEVPIAVISEESRDRVRTYVENAGLSLPMYVIDDVPAPFEGRAIPRTYVVRDDGQVVYRHVGAADWNAEPVHRLLDRFRPSEAARVSGADRESMSAVGDV
jgi:hypothetical protein